MNIDYKIFYVTLPGLAIIIIAECIEMLRERRSISDKKDMLTSLSIGMVAIIISGFIKGAVSFVFTLMYQFRIMTLPSNLWWVWIICFFGDDISYYWFHRCSHHVRFLWASHSVHHSAETYNLTGALRLPWTSNITGTFLFWAWMPLIGINPAMIITMKSISALYQFWLHTERIKKMPRSFEAIFNTPSHHRVHHASNAAYLDKNHGGTLMICDHLFGTFMEEAHQPVYGLTKKTKSANPVVIAFHEWREMINDIKKTKKPSDWINLIFNSPGWGGK